MRLFLTRSADPWFIRESLLVVTDSRDEEVLVTKLEARLRARCRTEPWDGDPVPCLIWGGAKADAGQGRIRVGREVLATHRLMWSIAHLQDPPDEQLVVQRCARPACCEPTHLQLATTRARRRSQAARGLSQGRSVPHTVDDCLRRAGLLTAQLARIRQRRDWLLRRSEMLLAQFDPRSPTSSSIDQT